VGAVAAGQRAAREVIQSAVKIAQEDSGWICPAVKEPAAAATATAAAAATTIGGVCCGTIDAL